MAIDPVTAKLAAQAAMKIATDEEARKKLLYIILIPVIFILVITAFSAYIASSPFSILSGIFNQKEMAEVRAIKLEYEDEDLDEAVDFDLPEKLIVDSQSQFAYPAPGIKLGNRRFGYQMHPILHIPKMHTGVDISSAGCYGKPVIAAADGNVILVSRKTTGYGNFIVIEHKDDKGNTWHTRYGHLSQITVSKNESVTKGTVIGAIGSTGQSTGPHLHFEIMLNGKFVDPLKFIKYGS